MNNDTKNPFKIFKDWYTQALKSEDSYPDAFSLSSSTLEGRPSCRTVLLKIYDEQSFTFFTNYNSQKGQELIKNPQASMLFYWKTLKKQIRIQGDFIKSSKEVSDNYWSTRPYESCLHAFISNQSDELKLSSSEINNLMKETRRKHPQQIPRPENWGGFTLTPDYFEFWEEGDFRWHKRMVFKLNDEKKWDTKKLYP